MVRLIFIGFDLNLPFDEYGAVDFDFVQNLTGKKIAAYTHLFIVLGHLLYYENVVSFLYLDHAVSTFRIFSAKPHW